MVNKINAGTIYNVFFMMDFFSLFDKNAFKTELLQRNGKENICFGGQKTFNLVSQKDI